VDSKRSVKAKYISGECKTINASLINDPKIIAILFVITTYLDSTREEYQSFMLVIGAKIFHRTLCGVGQIVTASMNPGNVSGIVM